MTAPLTHHSLSAHGGLTESCMRTPIGKGREGNRKGIGREERVETPIHSSSSVGRAERLGWMGETR